VTFTTRGALYNHITLADLALLAGVDEKTLRNLASPKQTNRLQTVNIDGRAYVSLNVARPWLETRGFVPTVNEDQRPERDFNRDGFLSSLDLADYVRAVREQRGLSQEQLAKRMRAPGALEAVRAVEERRSAISENAAVLLGNALEVKDPKTFADAVLELEKRWYDTVPN
jgi:DNA-binding transcriptional regulator YiaG